MGTLARAHKGEDDVMSVNNVKTVLDVNGYALYFSRRAEHAKESTIRCLWKAGDPSPAPLTAPARRARRALIPHNKKGKYDPNTHYWRKLGIYSYRSDFLPTLCAPTTPFEDWK